MQHTCLPADTTLLSKWRSFGGLTYAYLRGSDKRGSGGVARMSGECQHILVSLFIAPHHTVRYDHPERPTMTFLLFSSFACAHTFVASINTPFRRYPCNWCTFRECICLTTFSPWTCIVLRCLFFICTLFNERFLNNTDYTAWNGRLTGGWWTGKDVKWSSRHNWSYFPGICLDGLRKIAKTLTISEDSWSPSQNLTPLPQYEAGVLNTRPRRSFGLSYLFCAFWPLDLSAYTHYGTNYMSNLHNVFVMFVKLHARLKIHPQCLRTLEFHPLFLLQSFEYVHSTATFVRIVGGQFKLHTRF
jgi:hypothetical protein